MELFGLFALATVAIVLCFSSLMVGACIMLVYGRYYYDRSEEDGSRNWPWFRSHRFWRYIKHIPLRTQGELPERCIYAVFPHGLMTLTTIFAFGAHGGDSPCPDVAIAGTRILLWLPVVRDVFLWIGGINATKRNIKRVLLEQKRSVAILPGGVREMAMAGQQPLQLYREHQGFLQVAWDHDIAVVPVYAHNENQAVTVWNPFPRLRQWCLDTLGYPFPAIFWGPWRIPLTAYVGQPLVPTKYRQVADFREAYWAAVDALLKDHPE